MPENLQTKANELRTLCEAAEIYGDSQSPEARLLRIVCFKLSELLPMLEILSEKPDVRIQGRKRKPAESKKVG